MPDLRRLRHKVKAIKDLRVRGGGQKLIPHRREQNQAFTTIIRPHPYILVNLGNNLLVGRRQLHLFGRKLLVKVRSRVFGLVLGHIWRLDLWIKRVLRGINKMKILCAFP